MFDITVSDRLLHPHAVMLFAIYITGWLTAGWFWLKFKHIRSVHLLSKAVFIIFSILFLYFMIFARNPDHDEIEHIHASWQMASGLLPFTDFFQHHSPMLWILLSPLFKLTLIENHPVDSFRIISTLFSLLALLIAIRLAQIVWQDSKTKWIVLFLFLSNFIRMELSISPTGIFRLIEFLNQGTAAQRWLLQAKHLFLWKSPVNSINIGQKKNNINGRRKQPKY